MRIFKELAFIGILYILAAQHVAGCPLPLASGTWFSSTRGTWVVSGDQTSVSGYIAGLTSAPTQTLNCISQGSTSTQYILGTTFEIFFGAFIDVYTCIDIRAISDGNSYLYYIVTPVDTATGEEFTSDQTLACTINTNYESAVNARVVVRDGAHSDAALQLPDVILGNYSLEFSDENSQTIVNNTMDSCTNKTVMQFTKSDQATNIAFSSSGELYSIYSVTSGGYTYVHMFNSDATISSTDIASQRFTCWVLGSSGSLVQGTAYPEACYTEQTSVSVKYPGQTFAFDPYYTCAATSPAEEDTGLAGWAIALIVLGVLAFLVLLAIIIVFCYMRKNKNQLDEELGKFIKNGERQSSPDSIPDPDLDKEKPQKKEATKSKKTPRRRKKKNLRERTMDLTEVVTKENNQKLQDGRQPSSRDLKSVTPGPIDPIEFPPGKKSIPPTTPKPDDDDMTLQRIKKEREKREKEREEKRKRKEKQAEELRKKLEHQALEPEVPVEQVIRHVRPPSRSEDEYETDDSEKEQRTQKLLQKRKRLAQASYEPPDGVPDARVVGRKKRRGLKEGEDGGEIKTNLMTREEHEKNDKRRKHRKKTLKKMAHQRFRKSPSDADTSDTDAEGTRVKRRRAGDPRGVKAPHLEKYIVKKDLEHDLDEQDYWHEKELNNPQPIVADDDGEYNQTYTEEKNTKKVEVIPAETSNAGTRENDVTLRTQYDVIMQEETGALAEMGFKTGPNGELPEGFHFDNDGNVVRTIDNKVILSKDSYAKHMEFRRKFGVFGLPRLIRNTDGRPTGGYKDDEFGPTAEWDFGDTMTLPEVEDDRKHTQMSHRPSSGKQVGFNTADDRSMPPSTPPDDFDYSQRKGRQLGSAERSLLKQRLFEDDKPALEQQRQPSLPIYFVGSKGGVKPESIYVDNSHVRRQEPPTQKKSSSAGSHMITRSDTFDDGRMSQKLKRNTRLRASWAGREDSILEEPEEGVTGISRDRRNIGSDDEFILVHGSMRKLHGQADKPDINFPAHICPRYERHSNTPTGLEREPTDRNMRTATETQAPIAGRHMRRYLEELYKDKVYFDRYVKTEVLPTNAAVETVELANQARGFLNDRAEYWADNQPAPAPPPSSLGLRLSRMRTMYHTTDSGMDSMRTSAMERPLSADDAQEGGAMSRMHSRESTSIALPSHRSRSTGNEAANTDRVPPTGRSMEPLNVEKNDSPKKEKCVIIDESPRKPKAGDSGKVSPDAKQSPKEGNLNNITVLPGNVLSITDHT